MHFSVEDGECLQGVVVGGFENSHLLGQRERFILFARALQTDGLQNLQCDISRMFNTMLFQDNEFDRQTLKSARV